VTAAPALATTAAAGSIYFASAAVVLGASPSADITAASLTASATTFHTLTATTTSYGFSFNLTKAQFDQMNSTKLSEKAHAHYKAENVASNGASTVTYAKLYTGDLYLVISAATTAVVIDTKAANEVCGKGFTSVASASSQDTFIGSLLALAFF
jgi:hypothetical protein